jgi:hypothetical protein
MRSSGEIFTGKSKSGNNGTANISLQLSVIKSDEDLKLFVTATYTKREINSGIVIPTTYDNISENNDSVMNLSVINSKLMNIRIYSSKQLYKNNEIIKADIFVTDDKGSPVVANLSVSASNSVFNSAQLHNDKITDPLLPECSFLWRRIINYWSSKIPI